MRDEIFHAMADGMIGRFWPLIAGVPEQPGIHGAIRRDEEGYWVVDLEGWRSIGEGKGPNRGYPDTLIGVLGRGTVFLSDRRRWKDFDLWSGQRIHVVRLWYATAVTGPDVNTVEADGVILGGAIFPNQSAWTKFGHPEWRVRNATDQLGEGWSLDFKKITKSRFNIGNGLVLEVEPT